ncbi:replicative DNA helicase [Paenibacillus albidus]|uniref:Replicative DNA helicase n=2 Tax=Paenibacillus albidus TaxID=2041023 RepID=A0A917C776_9BACL|nr:replicative DNA helicase [Paenibacillus albidus]
MNYDPDSSSEEFKLPISMETEQVVLGSIILEPDLMHTAVEIMDQGAMYGQAHRHIYTAMCQLHKAGDPIDLVSLIKKLKDNRHLVLVGGTSYLTNLYQSIPSTANFSYHVGVLNENSMLRKIIRAGYKQMRAASEDRDVGQALISMQSTVDHLMAQSSAAREPDFIPLQQLGVQALEQMEEQVLTHGGGINGVPSGFRDLDNMTNGFQESDLIIIAARPSVGKTAVALNIASNASKCVTAPIAVFSLEQPRQQVTKRFISSEGQVDANRIRTVNMSDSDWGRAVDTVAQFGNILVNDSPGLTVWDIRTKARRLKQEKGLAMIIIDYLQLIRGNSKSTENRQQEVSEISRTLKQIARELDVPIIALSQLSRNVEQRQDKRPMMSDLRESGSIEQDADVVAFLYRDDYYNADSEKKNIIEIIIAKQRNGPVGTVELVFLKNFNKFVNYERNHNQDQKLGDAR